MKTSIDLVVTVLYESFIPLTMVAAACFYLCSATVVATAPGATSIQVSRIARSHGGLSGGASAGKSGYDLTFAIAYLRDFALLFDVLGESFETFVSWTALEGLCEKVRRLILFQREIERDVARAQGLPQRLV